MTELRSMKKVRNDINNWLADNGYGKINTETPLNGGCINETSLISTTENRQFFLKQKRNPPANFFTAEASGLAAMEKSNTIRVPKVYQASDHFLLLEYLEPSPPHTAFWQNLGESLAMMHREIAPSFGFEMDNYCGTTLQHNSTITDGHEFFARYRLMALGAAARDKGLLSATDLKRASLLGKTEVSSGIEISLPKEMKAFKSFSRQGPPKENPGLR